MSKRKQWRSKEDVLLDDDDEEIWSEGESVDDLAALEDVVRKCLDPVLSELRMKFKEVKDLLCLLQQAREPYIS